MCINVLSLFDGLSAGRVALERAGIKVNKYFASEIEPQPMAITQYHYPDTIQLGDIREWESWDLPKIDLLLAGSPCTQISQAGSRKGLEVNSLEDYRALKKNKHDFGKSQSYLFWEFVDVLRTYKPQYFLLENVRMKQEWADLISNAIGVDFTMLDSALVSGQNRKRFYWFGTLNEEGSYTTIPLKQPADKNIMLKDVVLPDVLPVCLHNLYGGFNEKAVRVFEGKSPTLRTAAGGGHIPSFVKEGFLDEEKVVTFTERRTEEAKRLRREHMAKTGKDFSPRRMKEVVPRTDDKANCITASLGIEHLILTDKALAYMDRKVKGGRTHWDFKHHSSIQDPKSATVVANFFKGIPYNVFKDFDCIRKFDPVEVERLQTFKDNYTNVPYKGKPMSNTARYKSLGNSWTIDVVARIFSYMKKDLTEWK